MKISSPIPIKIIPPKTEAFQESFVPNFLPLPIPAVPKLSVIEPNTEELKASIKNYLQDVR